MIMKKWLFLAFCGLLSACSQSGIEELNTPMGGDTPIFYASVEGADAESRTYLDETGKMRWTHDDRITIFFGENYNREFAFVGATGTTAGSFEQISTDGFYTAEKMAANYAIYPHAAKTILEAEGYFKCTLPATQNYAEGSFGLNANTMVSVTKSVDDRFLQFKNVGGYLKLNLYGDDVTVAQITLQGNNDEPLAGAAIITPTYGGEPTLTWAASGTTQVLTLDCGSGVKIGQTEEDATAFYLVVPPTTFEKGFAVTITDTEGKVCTKSTSNEQTFTRNVTKNMPAFEAKCKAPNSVPSNQIWYTSTDGNIVTLYKTGAFGVAIKSNTYTDGKGVITFEGDVTTIGRGAFHNCKSLASITLPEGVTTIGENAFYGCTSLASITLPEGVTTIGDNAFQGCTSLTNITLPEGVTTIGKYAFRYCSHLASITLPEGVTTIGANAFFDCRSLASITIPESVTELGAGAFSRCSNLQHFEGKYASDNGRCLIKENVLIAFAPVGLTTYTVPEGVTTIGQYTFYNCTSLASINIPEGVTTIGNYAFRTCTSLASITLPKSLTTIGELAFESCTSLVSITLPEGLTTIGANAFYGCTSLASITIPESVTELGAGAFANCSNLQHFEGKYASDNGRCLIKENVLIAFAPVGLTTYTVPEGVTTIGARAFENCESLASITLPEGVTTIAFRAFYRCTSLASITLPEGVTTIGDDAFEYCTSLASITIPEGVTTIGSYAFRDCTSLASITLPEGVTTIGQFTFYNCPSLKSVYCKPTTPPTGRVNMFNNNASGRKIYVPASDDDSIIKAYKAAEYWSSYASDMEEYQF